MGHFCMPIHTDGALLVVDCIREAIHNDIILATPPDGQTCKRLFHKNEFCYKPDKKHGNNCMLLAIY